MSFYGLFWENKNLDYELNGFVFSISVFKLENNGLRELLGISREAFLLLKGEDTSESTSLSPLLTSTDVSLRKS